jgi:hypothetical protein
MNNNSVRTLARKQDRPAAGWLALCRAAAISLALGAALATAGAPSRAACHDVQVYIYAPDGTPLLTQGWTVGGGQVSDPDGIQYTVDAADYIDDDTGTAIGYIVIE